MFDVGGTTFTADATSELTTTGHYSWPLPAGFAWIEAQDVTVGVKVANFVPTGAPGISGTAVVGQELTATTAGISDGDGTTRAEDGDTGYAYAWQWIRVDGSTETDISGETSKTYTLVAADDGKKVKVKAVSFKDDRDNAEGPLTSEAYPSSGTIAPVTVNNLPVFTDGTPQTRTLAETVGGATVSAAANIGAAVVATDDDAGDTLTYALDGHGQGQVHLRHRVGPDQDQGRGTIRLRGEVELFGDGDGDRRHGDGIGRRDHQRDEQHGRDAGCAGPADGRRDRRELDEPGRELGPAGHRRPPGHRDLRPAVQEERGHHLDGRPAGRDDDE